MATSPFADSGVSSFTLKSIDGKPIPLADYRGKVRPSSECRQSVRTQERHVGLIQLLA
jgi:hypothetical protein